jgi:hypothetical protein
MPKAETETTDLLTALQGPIIEAAVKWHYERTDGKLAALGAATNYCVKEFEKQIREALYV